MAMTDLIELRLGSSRWIRVCHRLLSLLGLIALCTSPISNGWLGAAVGTLFLMHVLTARMMARAAGAERLVLQGNGNAMLLAGGSSRPARYRGAGWASRWLCVLPLETLDDCCSRHCIVCSSRNSSDAWRHLLVWLRADVAPERGQNLEWP